MQESNNENTMQEYNVFISHKVDDRAIASMLQTALENLCGRHNRGRFEVFVCEQAPGGTDWRDWIRDSIARSTVLIFLYTDVDADWSWCQFEVGSFIGRAESEKGRRKVLCLKNSTIDELPSTIQDFQAYDADKEGIEKLFEELLNSEDILPERLNPDLRQGKFVRQFDGYVQDIVTSFTVTNKTNFFDRRIDIILCEDAGPESQEAELDEASISVDPETMRILHISGHNVRWKDLATSFKERGQSDWIDELEESITQIKDGQKAREVLKPFEADDGNVYIPVIARIETLQRRDEERTITPKMLRVIFVPSPESEAMLTLAKFFDYNQWYTYPPACVVRIKWRKQSGKSEYVNDDLEEGPVVCAINSSCAHLYDRNDQMIRNNPTPIEELVEGIKPYVSAQNMKRFENDQEKVARRIVFQNKNAIPEVPLQFNEYHPDYQFKNQVYLPLLIGKQVIGEVSKPHETYLLIAYIKDFYPPDESES